MIVYTGGTGPGPDHALRIRDGNTVAAIPKSYSYKGFNAAQTSGLTEP